MSEATNATQSVQRLAPRTPLIPAPVRGAGLPLDGEYCTRVDQLEYDGETFREGDVVLCRQQYSEPRKFEGVRWRQRVATLLELYIEDHPNVHALRGFAEAVSDGERMRIWINRDRPTRYALGLTDAPAPKQGMLW